MGNNAIFLKASKEGIKGILLLPEATCSIADHDITSYVENYMLKSLYCEVCLSGGGILHNQRFSGMNGLYVEIAQDIRGKSRSD